MIDRILGRRSPRAAKKKLRLGRTAGGAGKSSIPEPLPVIVIHRGRFNQGRTARGDTRKQFNGRAGLESTLIASSPKHESLRQTARALKGANKSLISRSTSAYAEAQGDHDKDVVIVSGARCNKLPGK